MSDVAEAQESSKASAPTVPPWDQLRQAREQHNLTQLEVAKELKLDLRFVKALEEGKMDDLPEPVYTAGYVRAYAKLIGLPPDDVVSAYASQETTSMPEITQAREKIPARYRHVDNSLPKSFSVSHSNDGEKKSLRLLIGILGAAVLFAIAWQVVENMQSTDSSAPQDASDEMSTLDAQQGDQFSASNNTETKTIDLTLPGQSPAAGNTSAQGASGQNAKAESTQESATKMSTITLHYSEDSWIDIRDATGKALIRRLGKAGSSQTVKGVPPFDVLLGFSPGVTLEYNGEPYDLARFAKGPVARFVLIDPAKEQ